MKKKLMFLFFAVLIFSNTASAIDLLSNEELVQDLLSKVTDFIMVRMRVDSIIQFMLNNWGFTLFLIVALFILYIYFKVREHYFEDTSRFSKLLLRETSDDDRNKILNELDFLKKQKRMKEKLVKKRRKMLSQFLEKDDSSQLKQKDEKTELILAKAYKDDILSILDDRRKVSLNDLVQELGVSQDILLGWIDNLRKIGQVRVEKENNETYIKITGEKNILDELTKEERKVVGPEDLHLKDIIDLLNEKKKISLQEITRLFQQPLSVIEPYVRFLEEINLIDVDYKMGTTILVKKGILREEKKNQTREEIKRKLLDATHKIEDFEIGKHIDTEIPEIYPSLHDYNDRLDVERMIAKRLTDITGSFRISQVMKKLEELYPDNEDIKNRVEIVEEIKEWVSKDPTCVEAKKEGDTTYYKFL